ncbi:TonB-dependent receptor plug domain-containing protein [Robertkochia flava]|uniref:TonB-dependent receptor plug domain-containing protein n=1 Tax=Robertkochia flava TaxID=3447986 RepID=UPI001CCF8579|nr:TonB-dependent receptor [Robertkochia marina]
MKKQTWLLSLCVLSAVSLTAQQKETSVQKDKVLDLEEVVVSDSRFALKREQSGKTVISITREDLEKQPGNSLASIINNYSGIEINGSRSNAGQNLNYYIRGGSNRQVLIMVDGIQMNDPSQISGDYDLRLIDVSQVESVEIIKGAASTLYGNAAATAVIRISTRKETQRKLAATLNSAIGTNQNSEDQNYGLRDFNNNLSLGGVLGNLDYTVALGHSYTDGLSSVEGDERDPFERLNSRVQLGYRFSEKFKVKLGASYDDFKADFDSAFPLEDADYFSESRQRRIQLSPEYNYGKGQIFMNASYYAIDRDFQSAFPSSYKAENLVADIYHKYILNERFYTILGFNHISSKADLGLGMYESFSINDPYANVVYVSDFGFHLNTGVRWNNHSTYGSNFTYSFNPSYTIRFEEDYLKFMSSYASSFIAPTLSQLYGAFGANPDLEPEENQTFEAGVEYKAGFFRVSALYFNRSEKNFIDYRTIDFDTFEGEYYNVDESFRVEGVELEFKSNISKTLLLNGNYTFTEIRGRQALRIPRHKINANLNYVLASSTSIDLHYQFTGEREDINFATFENEVLKAFNVVDLGVSHGFNSHLRATLSVNNIFNEDYRELIGYPTRGRNITAGIKVML